MFFSHHKTHREIFLALQQKNVSYVSKITLPSSINNEQIFLNILVSLKFLTTTNITNQIKKLLQALNNKEKELSCIQLQVTKLEGLNSNLTKDKSKLEGKVLQKDRSIQDLTRKNEYLENKVGI